MCELYNKVISSPLVSVIIPTYNREKLLPNAIESVINQTYGNWELLVVDDRSTDNTRKVVEEYIKRDKRINYIINDRTKGPAGARNCGIYKSRGKYVAFLDSDDEWIETHLSESIEVLENENINVCFSLWYERRSGKLIKCDEIGHRKNRLEKVISDLNLKVKGKLIFFDDRFYEYNLLQQVYCYHINTIVFNRNILEVTGMFNEKLFCSEDIDFIYRVLYNFNFCLIKDYHFIYNQGNDNLYFFLDRSAINLEEIINNKTIVDKLTREGKYKNYMRKIRKEFIKKSNKIKHKKICIQELNKLIEKKYFTLGYINSRVNKIRAVRYYIISLFYEFNFEKIKFILKTIFMPRFCKIKIDSSRFDLT